MMTSYYNYGMIKYFGTLFGFKMFTQRHMIFIDVYIICRLSVLCVRRLQWLRIWLYSFNVDTRIYDVFEYYNFLWPVQKLNISF